MTSNIAQLKYILNCFLNKLGFPRARCSCCSDETREIFQLKPRIKCQVCVFQSVLKFSERFCSRIGAKQFQSPVRDLTVQTSCYLDLLDLPLQSIYTMFFPLILQIILEFSGVTGFVDSALNGVELRVIPIDVSK